jgi:hypothetical protein
MEHSLDLIGIVNKDFMQETGDRISALPKTTINSEVDYNQINRITDPINPFVSELEFS